MERMIRTSNDPPLPQRLSYTTVCLRDLAEEQEDGEDLGFGVRGAFVLVGGDVEEGGGEGVLQAFSDEHPGEIVSRSRTLKIGKRRGIGLSLARQGRRKGDRANLELEDATDAAKSGDDEVSMLGI
jgi:hypothetical protein